MFIMELLCFIKISSSNLLNLDALFLGELIEILRGMSSGQETILGSGESDSMSKKHLHTPSNELRMQIFQMSQTNLWIIQMLRLFRQRTSMHQLWEAREISQSLDVWLCRDNKMEILMITILTYLHYQDQLDSITGYLLQHFSSVVQAIEPMSVQFQSSKHRHKTKHHIHMQDMPL